MTNHSLPIVPGMIFGRLTVIERTGKTPNGHIVWRCRCDCGEITEAAASDLGRTKFSCGCLLRERIRRGGDYKSPLYICWCHIKQRCLNPKDKSYKNYGARGIGMAPEWIDDYVAFKTYIDKHLGPRPSPKHSIDRIENSEGYFPGNLKWSTGSEQIHNSRGSKLNKAIDKLLLECINDL